MVRPPTKIETKTELLTPVDKGLEGLESLAWLMDKAFRIPGTQFRVGIDAILGLIPVGGDVLAGIIQVGIVAVALYRYKVPKVVAARMASNVLLDLAVGALPFVGDAFDVFFKANTRNLKLLSEVKQLQAVNQPVPTAPSRWYFVGLVGGLVGVLLLLFAGAVALAVWIVRWGMDRPGF